MRRPLKPALLALTAAWSAMAAPALVCGVEPLGGLALVLTVGLAGLYLTEPRR